MSEKRCKFNKCGLGVIVRCIRAAAEGLNEIDNKDGSAIPVDHRVQCTTIMRGVCKATRVLRQAVNLVITFCRSSMQVGSVQGNYLVRLITYLARLALEVGMYATWEFDPKHEMASGAAMTCKLLGG